ncbi:hypothetical protein SEVIR_7G250875v4 [Setaria viridis]|uniref:Uncharacterized protein n=1 Tax=Setaria viridis TaxID=4556 RepID=A0A4U6TU62_SETVI|nr:uncharacterized protein LOC117863139 [Setaria viridis]TKW06608.1 hypothetical protein SEVIR_7G250875v2 [Setaria viridis]
MAWTEAAMRRAGAFVTLAAASALVLLLFPAPAAVDRGYELVPILALFVALLLGCAAVLLSPAATAPARAILAVQWRAATARELRWVGFTAVVFCAGHVVRAVVREEPAAEEEEVSTDKVGAVAILSLVFLAGVWTVNLSVLTGRVGSRSVTQPPPPPLQAPEEELDCA